MKLLKHRLIPAAAALVLVFAAIITSCPDKASALVTDEDIRAMEERIKSTSEKIKEYQAKIENLRRNISSTVSLKNTIDAQIKAMQDNIDDTETLINTYETVISSLSEDIKSKETEYNNKYSEFLRLMRVYHEDNTANYLDMILNSGSLIEFLTQYERIGSLLNYEETLMQELNLETVDIKGMKNDLVGKREAAESLRLQQEARKAELVKKLEDTQTLIDQYNKDQSVALRTLEETQKLDSELDAQLTKLLKQLEEQNRNKYVGGLFLWPVDADLSRLSSKFGSRVVWNKPDYHLGIDIVHAQYQNIYGRNIYAANDGKVVTATNHSSYGNYILLDHGGGYATIYAHCSRLLVKSGDTVKRGQVIARIGSTGMSTGNHLHFEVRINGKAVNPLDGYISYPSNLIIG
ncbi:MAG: peptidoglycan DD-metalloendopeptidase family protein [Firmicutes bacterium]|nr:peptidoglycan DD-metalloendopeptidase family protein [Bacillota bacterium]